MLLIQETRHVLREVRRTPRFAVSYVVVAGAVACGVALAAAVVDSMLLEPLPFADAKATYQVVREHADGFETTRVPGELVDAWQGLDGVDVAAVQDGRKETVFYHSGSGGAARLIGAGVSTNYFELLGISPWRGRAFTPTDVGLSSIILSYGAGQRLFGDAAAGVGSTLVLNGRAYAVVGIMPPGFVVPPPPGHPEPDARVDAWVPIPMGGAADADHVWVRLNSQRSRADLSGRLLRAGRELEAEPTVRIHVHSLREVLVEPARTWVGGLVFAASIAFGFGLLTALGLVFVRRVGASKALTLHRYYGATSGRLILRSAGETTALSVVGAGLGLLLAVWLLGVLKSAGPIELARLAAVEIDATALWVTAGAAVLLGLVSGAVPAALLLPWLPSSSGLAGRSIGAAPALQSLRSGVVIVQFALACALGVCGLMLTMTVRALNERAPVADPRSVVVVDLPRPITSDSAQNRVFYGNAVREVAAISGVRDVGLGSSIPLRARDYFGRRWALRVADAGYFRALGVEIVAGRSFGSADAGGGEVAIVNETLARQEFGESGAVGKVLDDRLVVGVVRDHVHRGLDQEVEPAMYVPVIQGHENRLSMIVAIAGVSPASLIPSIRASLATLDPGQPLDELTTLATIARRSPALSHRAFQRLSLLVLTVLAAGLALMGLVSVLVQYIADHRREIALRMALGGPPNLQRRMVLRTATRLLTAALAVGLPLSFGLAHVIRSSFFAVAPLDPVPYLITVVAFTMIIAVVTMTAPKQDERQLNELLKVE